LIGAAQKKRRKGTRKNGGRSRLAKPEETHQPAEQNDSSYLSLFVHMSVNKKLKQKI
jgi:hypothetical protein